MKKIILPVITLYACFGAGAQTLKWDSTFRPANYLVKAEQFSSYPNAPGDIIFLGNSITAGTDWNELLGVAIAKNRGISGDITFGVLERLKEVTEGKPAKVFILIGINDISRNVPDSFILDNYKKIIRQIRAQSPATKIFFQTILPVNNTFPDKNQFNKDEHILYINNELKKLAATEKITVVDIYPHFLDADKRLEKSLTMDGLHLNAAGYNRWATLLKPYLNQ
jgi:lysophospholipase L1-like esterase